MMHLLKSFDFKIMSLFFKIRDRIRPPAAILAEIRVRSGDIVLDYGCGPGSFTRAASELVGDEGRVYALDINPLAIDRIKRDAARRGRRNISTLYSDCATGLESGSVDVVLLYDVFHDLHDPDSVLEELHRIMHPEGVLSFSDHHMTDDQIVSQLTGSGLFSLSERKNHTALFVKR
jgi:ubiquinone/menaquinone biosynthesis C-methylase UbiE